MTKYLTQDAIGGSGTKYGDKGIAVEIIRESGDATIVRDQEGNCFPVKSSLLSDTCPELQEKIEEQETVIAKEVKERKKAEPVNQTKMF
jgi:SH3-like domain-containing protein